MFSSAVAIAYRDSEYEHFNYYSSIITDGEQSNTSLGITDVLHCAHSHRAHCLLPGVSLFLNFIGRKNTDKGFFHYNMFFIVAVERMIFVRKDLDNLLGIGTYWQGTITALSHRPPKAHCSRQRCSLMRHDLRNKLPRLGSNPPCLHLTL